MSHTPIRVHQAHLAEAADVGVTQLARVVEGEPDVRVGMDGRIRAANDELSGHAEMDEQPVRGAIAIGAVRGGQAQADEFAEAPDLLNCRAGERGFEAGDVGDEIGFAKAQGGNGAAREHGAQATDDCFDFGQFRHVGLKLP
jgi:hypothetical protein